jgi:hypothetical protein
MMSLNNKSNLFIISFLLFIGLNNSFSQNELPFFEQKAFDFYSNEILKQFPVKKKIYINTYFIDFQDTEYHSFIRPKCFKSLNSTGLDSLSKISFDIYNQFDFDSDKNELDLNRIDKKQFRVKKNKTNNYPRLRISSPYVYSSNYFINIHLIDKFKVVIYHLKIDCNGNVTDWCWREIFMAYLH